MNTAVILIDKIRFIGLELINLHDFSALIIRFFMNLFVVIILVRWLYYSVSKRKDYLFTYILISIIIFLLCYLLASVKLELGFALGLFVIFGIIRYRANAIPIKEMTCLFIVIGISVINALANKKISLAELAFTNVVILFVAYGYEKICLLKHESAKTILFFLPFILLLFIACEKDTDLTLYGNGTLTVNGNFNDGISSKDGLIIKSGTITVNAEDDGIRGKDYLIIKDGNISLVTGSNGLKSDNKTSTALGYIAIEKGIINIISGGDAITAQTNVIISDGEFMLTTGGGSSRSYNGLISAKGVKAAVGVTITCKTININSADDALHSNGSLLVNVGNFILSSGDDGMHADKELEINDSEVSIAKSYEGLESAEITINNSRISLVSSDDGFNATQGSAVEYNDNSNIFINSGYIYVNTSQGDGMDSNGNITVTGGTVIVHGPASDPEVGMDYNGECKISGGTFIISGINSNMTQAPSNSSAQYCVLVRFSSSQAAGSIVHIQDNNGNDIMTFAPVRAYQSIILSSPDLANGNTYSIYSGGNSTGIVTDGLYSGGSYSGGSLYKSFTISGIITTIGNSSFNPGGRP
jgi:hypothetical protein